MTEATPPSADHFNAVMALIGTVMAGFFAYMTVRLNTVHRLVNSGLTAVKEQLSSALDVIRTANLMIASSRQEVASLRNAMAEAGIRQPDAPAGPVPTPQSLPLEPPRKL